MTALDELPEVTSLFGIDLRAASMMIAAICIMHPVAYGCSLFKPISYLVVTIWILVSLFFVSSVVLLIGLIKDDPVLCSIWIWYSLIFVALMLMMMIILSMVFCSRKQRSRIIVAFSGMLWYIVTIYFILVVNSYRKQILIMNKLSAIKKEI